MVDVSTESVRESVSLGLGGKEPMEFGLCSETGVGAEGAFSCTGQVASPWTCATSQGAWTGRDSPGGKDLDPFPDSSQQGFVSSEEQACSGLVTEQTLNQRDAGDRMGWGG